MVLELYDVGLVTIGLALLGIAVLPLLVSERSISMPIFFVAFGMLVFAAPFGFAPPDPLEQGHTAERLAELGVIIALMAVGLKIDRPVGFKAWSSTWRLLAITMPLTIAAAAFLGWWLVGFLVPTAVLLGAVIAPTDPVLASEVQVQEPGASGEEEVESDEANREEEVRFALTSEAGLNDGLAFPFTNLAIVIALVGIAPGNWVGEWLLIDVFYQILVGVLVGWAAGWMLARIIFTTMPETQVAQSVRGIEAIAGTLITYGLTELAGGYGFIAVFVAAVMIRGYERSHEYNESLHEITELAEQILMALIMVFFGGAIVGGLLAPLTTEAMIAAVVIVFLVRPLAGMIGFIGFDRPWTERATVSFFGIRGIGTFYYLAYGLNNAAFADADLLWALAGAIVLVSIVVHGITATPVIARITD